jgi:hypothetical protein
MGIYTILQPVSDPIVHSLTIMNIIAVLSRIGGKSLPEQSACSFYFPTFFGTAK